MICTFLFPQTKKWSVPQKPFKIRLYVATVLAVLKPKTVLISVYDFRFRFLFYVCVSTLFICLLFLLFGLLWNKFLMVLRGIINCSKCYTTLSKNPKIKNINLNINVVVVRYIYIFFVYGFSSLKIKISKKKSTKKKMTKWKEQPK